MVVSSAIASLPLLSPAISLHLRRLRSQLHPCEASSGRSRTVRATLFLTLPPLPLTLAHATVTAVHCWPLAFLQVFLWCSRSLASSLRFFLAVGVPPGCLPLAACFLRGGGCGCGCEFWPWSMWTSSFVQLPSFVWTASCECSLPSFVHGLAPSALVLFV